MENKIDLFVSYSYRTSRKKSIEDDAFVGLMVQEGFEIPDGLTRSMITELRKYLAGQHQVKVDQITIQNIVRLEPEVMDVPERGSQVDGPVGPPGVSGGPPEIPRELADAMAAHAASKAGGVVPEVQNADGQGDSAPVVEEGA